jgi:hypothetical protein
VLELLGLTAHEESVYQELLGRPPSSLPEIAELVPSLSHVDAVIEALVQKGLVKRHGQTYAAANPDIVLGDQLTAFEERLRRARLHVQSLSDRHRAAPQYAAAPPVELVPPSEVIDRYFAVQRSARTQVRALEAPPYATDGAKATEQSDSLDRGIGYRIVYGRAAVEAQGPDLLTRCIAKGEQARVVGEVPLKLLLVDDRNALLPARPGRLLTEGMLVVSGGALLHALSALFEAVWLTALPLNLEPDRSQPRQVPDDNTIIALLGAGLGDQAIAHHLGVGLRTVERRIQGIMQRFNAVTRFQAGLFAGRRPEPG